MKIFLAAVLAVGVNAEMVALPSSGLWFTGGYSAGVLADWDACKAACQVDANCAAAHFCDHGSGSRYGECYLGTAFSATELSAGCSAVSNAKKALPMEPLPSSGLWHTGGYGAGVVADWDACKAACQLDDNCAAAHFCDHGSGSRYGECYLGTGVSATEQSAGCGGVSNAKKMSTDFPTNAPTNAPTESPTGTPTVDPTGAPTAGPTAAPTGAPTQNPTVAPTGAPTASHVDTATALAAYGSGSFVGVDGDDVYHCSDAHDGCLVNSRTTRSQWTRVTEVPYQADDSMQPFDSFTATTSDGAWATEPGAITFRNEVDQYAQKFPASCDCQSGGKD